MYKKSWKHKAPERQGKAEFPRGEIENTMSKAAHKAASESTGKFFPGGREE